MNCIPAQTTHSTFSCITLHAKLFIYQRNICKIENNKVKECILTVNNTTLKL